MAFSAGEFLLYSGVRSRCRLGMHDVAVEGHDVVGEEDDGVGGGSSSRGAVILLTGSTFQVDLYVAKSSLQITGITHLSREVERIPSA